MQVLVIILQVLIPVLVHGQMNPGIANYRSPYSSNGQMYQTSHQGESGFANWFYNLMKSMSFLNLFGSPQQINPSAPSASYNGQKIPSQYLEEDASMLVQQAVLPQKQYSSNPGLQFAKRRNANENYSFQGTYRGQQGASTSSNLNSYLQNIFQLPTAKPQKPKDLSYFHGTYRNDVVNDMNPIYHEMTQPQIPYMETPYGKKQKKQCNKYPTDSTNYMKQPCRKKATSTTEKPVNYGTKEEQEEDDEDSKDDGEEEEKEEKNPCPPIGVWFWNGEVCIASGPVPTWACRPRDLVTTGRVGTCRNKIILGGPAGLGPFRRNSA